MMTKPRKGRLKRWSLDGVTERWSLDQQIDMVLRLLRGESPDAVSKETGLPVEQLKQWLNAFMKAGTAELRSRFGHPRRSPKVDAARRAEDNAKILAAIESGELATAAEIVRATGLAKNRVSNRLHALKAAHRIEKRHGVYRTLPIGYKPTARRVDAHPKQRRPLLSDG